jgi:hypothetical protein
MVSRYYVIGLGMSLLSIICGLLRRCDVVTYVSSEDRTLGPDIEKVSTRRCQEQVENRPLTSN